MDLFIKDEIYRFLFENCNDALLLTHPNGEIYRANPAACEMFQSSEEEICQLGRSGIIDLNDLRFEAALTERLINGKTRAELNFKRKDGSIFPTDCTSAIFLDAAGKTWTVIIIRDISALKMTEDTLRKAQEEATHFATYDYLTGILNRRAFITELQKALSLSKRENTCLCIILLDIDNFKKINDTRGHNCGDAVLKIVANCLTENLRQYDTLGRYGGDEFIVIMPNTHAEEAYNVAERLRANVENTQLIYENNLVPMTISIGLTCYDQKRDEDASTLIKRVDENMYSAKQRRNFVCGV